MRKQAKPIGCRGFNYHVYALGATVCTMCGAAISEETRRILRRANAHVERINAIRERAGQYSLCPKHGRYPSGRCPRCP